MVKSTSSLFCCCLCFTVASAFHVGVELLNASASVGYRLPKVAQPISYIVELKLSSLNADTKDFEGVTGIIFELIQEAKEFQIHAKNIEIQSMMLLNNANSPIEVTYSPVDSVTDIVIISTRENLNIEEQYKLQISFKGKLNEVEMSGFYKSSYLEDGVTKYLATTQFEPTHAREAFPCFDEPEFKAKFTLKLTVPSEFIVQSNTPIQGVPTVVDSQMTKWSFKQTPSISSYLIAFTVSQFTSDDGFFGTTIPYKVWSRKDEASKRKLALEYGPKIIAELEKIFGIEYSSSGIGKMDVYAIPDFSAGAMENWGHVTFRETSLLYDEENSPNSNEQSILAVIAHEFTHMWFGDLVTLAWWNDVFLNEGFARYFQYFANTKVKPDWEMDQQFVIGPLHTALSVDSLESSVALSSDAVTPGEISARFDSISYHKGASVIRMTIHLMGEENFLSAIRKYLSDRAFGNSEANDLLTALNFYYTTDPEGPSLKDALKNWVFEPGYPLLSVRTEGDTIKIEQQRFLLSGKKDTEWYVPVSYETSTNANFADTTPKNWVLPGRPLVLVDVLKNQEWFILNTQQTGYYRVNYDDNLWNRISKALNADLGKIHVLNRAAVVNDLVNLAKADIIKYNKFLDITKFLQNEIEYYPWVAAFNGFSDIIDKLENMYLREEIRIHLSALITKVYNSVPINDLKPAEQIYTLKQVLVLDWATRLKKADSVTKTAALFANFKNKNEKPNKNLRSLVYCSAIRQSINVADFNFLWDKFVSSNDATEKVLILSALGCSQDVTILKLYLDKAFAPDSQIRLQDLSTAVSSLYNRNNDVGLNVLFNYTLQNYEKISTRYGKISNVVSLFNTLAGRFTSQAHFDQLKRLIALDEVHEDVKAAMQKAIDKSADHIMVVKSLENQLAEYFKKASGAGSIMNLNPFSTAFIFILLITIFNVVR